MFLLEANNESRKGKQDSMKAVSLTTETLLYDGYIFSYSLLFNLPPFKKLMKFYFIFPQLFCDCLNTWKRKMNDKLCNYSVRNESSCSIY